MDAIAEKSGVSKTTLYKHWRDKDASQVVSAFWTVYGR
jgi:AcrR family transcriptional regulator